MPSFARSTRFVASVILYPFPNFWLRKKPNIYDALGFLRSQDLPLEPKFYKALRFLRSALAMGFQGQNRFAITRLDNWDAFMLQSKPSIHLQKYIDTYFVHVPLVASSPRAHFHLKC